MELLPRPEDIVEESLVEAKPDGGLVDVLEVVAQVNSFLYTYIAVEHAAAAITIV